MKPLIRYSVLCGALLAATQFTAWAGEGRPAHDAESTALSRKGAVLATITARIQSIDLTNREVTLKGPLGNEVTFIVDKQVKRLGEAKVGDLITADYFVSVAAELRKPTADEQKHPLVYLDAAGKASESEAPAAGAMRRFKVVTTIEGLDRPSSTITVKGPLGHYHIARVEDPANLPKMRIGENIVVTVTEAMAISLEKVEKKSGGEKTEK